MNGLLFIYIIWANRQKWRGRWKSGEKKKCDIKKWIRFFCIPLNEFKTNKNIWNIYKINTNQLSWFKTKGKKENHFTWRSLIFSTFSLFFLVITERFFCEIIIKWTWFMHVIYVDEFLWVVQCEFVSMFCFGDGNVIGAVAVTAATCNHSIFNGSIHTYNTLFFIGANKKKLFCKWEMYLSI